MELQKRKLFEVTLGSYETPQDKRKKFEISESYNIESFTVVSTDAYGALADAGEYILQKEKEYNKESLELFVQEVKFISVIDIII